MWLLFYSVSAQCKELSSPHITSRPDKLNVSLSTFDKHRPSGTSQKKWSGLKAAFSDTILLPLPESFGGADSRFGTDVALDGDRAIIGAKGSLGHGVAYILDYDGSQWLKSATLIPNDAETEDNFGFSVSLQGSFAVVGAYSKNQNSGAAYVFRNNGGVWSQQQKLETNLGFANERFGYSVDISNFRILVGARGSRASLNTPGSAYVFELSGSTWELATKLNATNQHDQSLFGYSVSLGGGFSNPVALVGAPYTDYFNGNPALGAVYAFELINGNWSPSDKLTADDTANVSSFGKKVDYQSNRAAISADQQVYIFDKDINSWSQTQLLVANDDNPSVYENFGSSVSLSGNFVLIGSKYDNDKGENSGSVYLFELNGSSWTQKIKRLSLNGYKGNLFGHAVALDGDRALVGAWGLGKLDGLLSDATANGSAYVFDGDQLLQTAFILENDEATGDNFGVSVSLSGNRALIGAYLDDDEGENAGAAYLFELISGEWVIVEKLVADDPMVGDGFGWSVSLDGDRALIGSFIDNGFNSTNSAAYIFDSVKGIWSQTTKLIPLDDTDFNKFGVSVSLSNNRALVGAWGSESAYVFDLVSDVWEETQKLQSSDGTFFDNFGRSVSLDGNNILIGAMGDDDNGSASGSAYVFELTGNDWLETHKIKQPDGEAFDKFGAAVSLSNNKLIIGSPNDGQGSAHIFEFDSNNWNFSKKLLSYDGILDIDFGRSVKIEENIAIVGQKGAAYIFSTIEGVWSLYNYVRPSYRLFNSDINEYGVSIDLSNGRSIVGSAQDDLNGNDSGSAYIYTNILVSRIFNDGFEDF